MKGELSKTARLLREVFGESINNYDDLKVLTNKKNKISQAILNYARPLLEECDNYNYNYYHNAISFAVIVWNLCLLPENERETYYKELLNLMCGDDLEERVVWAKLIKIFMKRKKEMFPNDNRFIVNYKLIDRGKRMELTVAATVLEGNNAAVNDQVGIEQ